MAKYRHVIWDWNGTLLDDSWVCVEIINKLLRQRSLSPITHRQYEKEFDFPVIDFYRAIGFDFSLESYEVVAAEYTIEYDTRRFECKLQRDTISVLESCADSGLTQSILSAYQQTRLEEMIDFFRIRDFFTIISGQDDYYASGKIEKGKRMIEELDFDASEVLLVGDTVHDFEVAKAIGIDCVLYPSGHNSLERLKSCGIQVIDSLMEILTLLNGCNRRTSLITNSNI